MDIKPNNENINIDQGNINEEFIEDNNININEKHEINTHINNEINEEVNTNFSFKQICKEYCESYDNTQRKLDKFFEILLEENNGKSNFENLLSCNNEDEVNAILAMLNRDDVLKQLVNYPDILEIVSDIVNAEQYHYIFKDYTSEQKDGRKYYHIMTRSHINRIQLMQELGMKESFSDIYNSYQLKSQTDEPTKDIIQIFFAYLFGGVNNRNLETILSCNAESELTIICYMLKEPEVEQYLIGLLKNDKNLLKDVDDIINNNQNDVNSRIKNIIGEIINTINLMQTLGMEKSFKDIYDSYMVAITQEEQTQLINDFSNHFFGNNGDTLKKILSYEYQISYSELTVICYMLQDPDVERELIGLLKNDKNLLKDVDDIIKSNKNDVNIDIKTIIAQSINTIKLMQTLGMEKSFKDIYDSYMVAITQEEQTQLINDFSNHFFGNNGDTLKKILSYKYDISDSELDAICYMLRKPEVEKKLIGLLKNDKNLLKDVDDIINSNESYVNRDIKCIIAQSIDTIQLMKKSNIKISFQEILDDYELINPQIKGVSKREEVISDFIVSLVGNDNNTKKYLNDIFSFNVTGELNAIYQMLSKTEVKQSFIKMLRLENRLLENASTIIQQNKDNNQDDSYNENQEKENIISLLQECITQAEQESSKENNINNNDNIIINEIK